MKNLTIILSLLSAVLLTGCENDAASMAIGSSDHSISLTREQNWALSSTVNQKFVVARFPKCQRRYTIDPAAKVMPKIELYEVGPMLYAAHQSGSWYALGTEECVVQKFRTEDIPATPPGRLLGTFEQRAGKLAFIATEAGQPIGNKPAQ